MGHLFRFGTEMTRMNGLPFLEYFFWLPPLPPSLTPHWSRVESFPHQAYLYRDGRRVCRRKRLEGQGYLAAERNDKILQCDTQGFVY